ncbi:MAG: nitroreductase family deazaflavin-dependent oxidoreductase [Dehalococcoidia bacterium]|nr:nitroreductase family deazaflavin-dependent oxidoreductase [Dehalococcoidia bacterium]
MSEYVASPTTWAADQVKLYEESGGKEGTELRGLPVVIVTHNGRHSGHIRKTPLMRVKVDDSYVLVASLGGAPRNPVWYYNLIADPDVTVQDGEQVIEMRTRLVEDGDERARLWAASVAAYPDYDAYQERTERVIPLFFAEPR